MPTKLDYFEKICRVFICTLMSFTGSADAMPGVKWNIILGPYRKDMNFVLPMLYAVPD